MRNEVEKGKEVIDILYIRQMNELFDDGFVMVVIDVTYCSANKSQC